MSETVNLPALGESVTEGTVTRWLKEVGDEVAVDEPLVEVSTDKVDTEVPSPVAGVIEKILVEEDEDVEVGAPLVVIGDGSGSGDSDSDSSSEDSAEEEATDESQDSDDESGGFDQSEEPAQDKDAESAPKKSSGGSGTEVTLPALGESVTEGTVTRWLKEVGEEVEVDEPLLEVSTDKVDTEVPSPVAGTLLEIKVQEDEDAEVGQVLALIGDADAAGSSDDSQDSQDSAESEDSAESAESADSGDSADSAEEIEDAATSSSTPEATDEAADKKASSETKESAKDDSQNEAAPEKAEESTGTSGGAAAESSGDSGSAYVTPLVRKLAKDKGVDLGSVKGTGVGGRIRKQDVLAAAESAPASSGSGKSSLTPVADNGEPTTILPVSDKRGTTEKAPRIRMTIAKRMRESLQESAQLTQVTEVDMTRVASLRNKAKNGFQEKHGAKLTFLPFFAQAVAEALKANPALNCTFKEDQKEIVYNGSEDLAIAVDTPRGLLVPVIRNAGDMQLPGLASSIADLGARAKDGSIGPDELTGGTFTITNIGSFGALFDTPIINQPQVAILGTGTIVKRPMVIQDADGNDVIAIRHMCYLSLTYDHRIVDGADAGRFLQTMKARLEEGRFEGALEL
ncbi:MULTISPECIES: 2-oxoglutarate dehydrogenase, E2 component, dihydrolipoamide succinyltransferase [Kocuria]|uniref:Dihydrolipoamide acetyltransferase component of pyruvate dehydrogenase complex n=1 Tax=Kocuria subflava TaxID=1736139 RepID=A0A846U2H1_9MICC|nr:MULTISPECIES: 2-oxoglutarate dehydrogenase, E2 component, dihydrolipoamide succinyltransferase [Kocuria]NKE08911.1 2-oxoglutarate dehydrogenase, E2 component, dihydrolipoamide succinyltransferase [Kocuria subflava]